MKKYILYARVNSVRQSRKGASLEYQIKRLQEYATKNNLQIGEIISEVGSGASEKRDGIKKLLNKLSDGSLQGIICVDFSRLSRSSLISAKLWRLIYEKDIEIVTPNQTYKNNAESKLSLDMQTTLAEISRKHLSESIKRSLLAKKNRRRLKQLQV